jgi:MFS family permease
LSLAVGALPGVLHSPFAFVPLFLVVGIAQAGVRLGRKTYLVDGAPAAERPSYVAVGNTIIGLIALLGGVLGIIADVLSVQVLLAVFVGLTVLGVLAAWRMPEADQMVTAG